MVSDVLECWQFVGFALWEGWDIGGVHAASKHGRDLKTARHQPPLAFAGQAALGLAVATANRSRGGVAGDLFLRKHILENLT